MNDEPYDDVYAGTANNDLDVTSDRDDDRSIDFRVCPRCGEALEIASEERIFAANHLKNIEVNDAGQLVKIEWGMTEPDFGSSTTLFYCCDSCAEALPERYQAVIDQVLGNERDD